MFFMESVILGPEPKIRKELLCWYQARITLVLQKLVDENFSWDIYDEKYDFSVYLDQKNPEILIELDRSNEVILFNSFIKQSLYLIFIEGWKLYSKVDPESITTEINKEFEKLSYLFDKNLI